MGSPARTEAAWTAETSRSSFPMRPAIRGPRATTQAPVSVAMSTIASGSSSTARQSPSASTSRPSQSVLRTSIVLPLRISRTSPGLTARPPGMFSVVGAMPTTRTRTLRARQAPSVAITSAAPLMSVFIVIMPSKLLSVRPPESNVIPLPTSATVGTVPSSSVSGRPRLGLIDEPDEPRRLRRAGGDAENPPRRASTIASSSRMTATSPALSATSTAASARRAGVSAPAGSLARSRAGQVASAITARARARAGPRRRLRRRRRS